MTDPGAGQAQASLATDTAVYPAENAIPLLGLEAVNVSAWFSGHKVLERV